MERIRLRLRSRGWGRLAMGSKWVAAGALLFDPKGRVLLVRSRMRGTWEYPAGSSAGRESPLETCRREVGEEVGLRPESYRLIGVDFFHRGTPNGNLLFTFAAKLTENEMKGLRIQKLELTEHQWATRDEALELIAPRLKARLAELFGAYDNDKPVYLHTGEPVL